MSQQRKKLSGKKPAEIKKNSKPNPRPRSRGELEEGAERHLQSFMIGFQEMVSSARIVGTVVRPNGTTARFSLGFGDLLAQAKAAELFLDDAADLLGL